MGRGVKKWQTETIHKRTKGKKEGFDSPEAIKKVGELFKKSASTPGGQRSRFLLIRTGKFCRG